MKSTILSLNFIIIFLVHWTFGQQSEENGGGSGPVESAEEEIVAMIGEDCDPDLYQKHWGPFVQQAVQNRPDRPTIEEKLDEFLSLNFTGLKFRSICFNDKYPMDCPQDKKQCSCFTSADFTTSESSEGECVAPLGSLCFTETKDFFGIGCSPGLQCDILSTGNSLLHPGICCDGSTCTPPGIKMEKRHAILGGTCDPTNYAKYWEPILKGRFALVRKNTEKDQTYDAIQSGTAQLIRKLYDFGDNHRDKNKFRKSICLNWDTFMKCDESSLKCTCYSEPQNNILVNLVAIAGYRGTVKIDTCLAASGSLCEINTVHCDAGLECKRERKEDLIGICKVGNWTTPHPIHYVETSNSSMDRGKSTNSAHSNTRLIVMPFILLFTLIFIDIFQFNYVGYYTTRIDY